ncbi:hypothetical protein D9M69_105010 [compost metagenome]
MPARLMLPTQWQGMYSNSEHPSLCSGGGAAEIDRVPVHNGADVREDRKMAAAARNARFSMSADANTAGNTL